MMRKKYYLSVELFGSFAAATDLTTLSFRSDKVRALLAYLIMHRSTPVLRTDLVYRLFGDYTEQAGRKNLNLTLTRLRESLAPVQANLEHTTPLLESDRERVILHWQSDTCWADVVEFMALQEACQLHPHVVLAYCSQCQPRLQQMATLYRGPFLSDITLKDSPVFGEWQMWQQETFQQQALETLYVLTDNALAAADYQVAIRYAQQQLRIVPWQERTHRQLIQAFIETGQYAAALTQFAVLTDILSQKFKVAPGDETLALMAAVPKPVGAATPVAVAPAPLSSRHHDLIRLLLDPVNRLVTLCGQEDEAVEFAAAAATPLHSQFPDGVHQVSLAGCDPEQPETVAEAIAAALHLQLSAGQHSTRSTQHTLFSLLKPLRLLLILHPFTPFIRPTAPADGVTLVMAMLQEAPQVTIMVVALRPLHLQQEIVYRL